MSRGKSDSEIVKCPNCEMTWFTRMMCEPCAFRAGGADPNCETCHGTGDNGLTPAHVCPPPFPYEEAKLYADLGRASRGGIVVSQRTKARIRLGLQAGPDALL